MLYTIIVVADLYVLNWYHEVYEDAGSITLCAVSRAAVEHKAFIFDYYRRYYFRHYFRHYMAAIDGEDYDFPNHNFTAEPYYNFTMSPGETRCFEISIIDDDIAEYRYERFYLYLGIYDPYENTCDYWYTHIYDNDGKSCKSC